MLAVRNRRERMISCDLSPVFQDLFVGCVDKAYLGCSICHRPGKPETFKTQSLFIQNSLMSRGGRGSRKENF